MGEVIILSSRRKLPPLGVNFREAAPVGPKPNFDDPHSPDFFSEPALDKRLCDFLPYSDQQRLIRLQNQRNWTIEISDNRTITLSRKTDLSEVAQIKCPNPEQGARQFQYRLSSNGESGTATSFGNMIDKLIRHLDTGSPDIEPPGCWR